MMVNISRMELDRVLARYGKYGFDDKSILGMADKSVRQGMTPKAALVAVRLYLSHELGENEPFTREEIQLATSRTDAEMDAFEARADGEPTPLLWGKTSLN